MAAANTMIHSKFQGCWGAQTNKERRQQVEGLEARLAEASSRASEVAQVSVFCADYEALQWHSPTGSMCSGVSGGKLLNWA